MVHSFSVVGLVVRSSALRVRTDAVLPARDVGAHRGLATHLRPFGRRLRAGGANSVHWFADRDLALPDSGATRGILIPPSVGSRDPVDAHDPDTAAAEFSVSVFQLQPAPGRDRISGELGGSLHRESGKSGVGDGRSRA